MLIYSILNASVTPERSESLLARNETSLAGNENCLARNETRGGNVHLSGTVASKKSHFLIELQDRELKDLANEDTLLPTQMFPRLPARAAFVADTNFVSGTQKMFLILFRNILCPQQMFPSLHSPRNIMSNNVSATMCPRLPVASSKLRRQWQIERHQTKNAISKTMTALEL